jgi:hypothetical protein
VRARPSAPLRLRVPALPVALPRAAARGRVLVCALPCLVRAPMPRDTVCACRADGFLAQP